MKIFTVLLGFYVLLLAFMPCGDAETCEQQNTQAASEWPDHQHSDDNSDLCTPFCLCTCCGYSGFIFSFSALQFCFENTLVVQPAVTLVSTYHSIFTHSVWQPPKLG